MILDGPRWCRCWMFVQPAIVPLNFPNDVDPIPLLRCRFSIPIPRLRLTFPDYVDSFGELLIPTIVAGGVPVPFTLFCQFYLRRVL